MAKKADRPQVKKIEIPAHKPKKPKPQTNAEPKAKAKKPVSTKQKIEEKLSGKELAVKATKARKQVLGVTEDEVADIIAKKVGNSQDKDHYDEYLHMFKKLQTAIRMFEKELRFSKSTRNVYALIALYSQQREVIADIRAISDYTENINRIMTTLIQPLFSNITQSNLDIFYHIRKLVIETSKDDQTQYALKRLEDLMREQGRYLQDKYESSNERLVQIVTEGR